MKLKRLEVRLRPKNPVEQELIEALGAQDGIYGGKNGLLRECLGRGYTLLKQRMESLSGIGDDVTVLHTLAQTFASDEYGGYRVVKIYLDAHGRGAAPVQPETGSSPTRTDKPECKSDDLSEELQQVVQSALDAVTAEETPVIATAQTKPQEPPVDPAPPAGAAKRTVDWSQMRGLAGSAEKKN